MENIKINISKNHEKKLPSNLEAEQSLIGSILVNNDIIDEISNIVINHLKEIGLDVPEPNNADSDLPPVESTNTGEIR